MKDLFVGYEHLFPDTKSYVKGSGTSIFKNREQFLELMNIMQPVKTGLKFYKCKNITVEGIIIRDCAGLSLIQSGCEEIHYNNVKLIGMWSIDNIPGRIIDVTFNNIKITSDYDLTLN